MDPSVKKAYLKALENVNKAKGFENIAKAGANGEVMIEGALDAVSADSKFIKTARWLNKLSNSPALPIIGDALGLVVGTIVDTYDNKKMGYNGVQSFLGAFAGNLVGSAFGMVMDATSASLAAATAVISGPAAVVTVPTVYLGVMGVSISGDWWLTDNIQHALLPKHDSNKTFNEVGDLGAYFKRRGQEVGRWFKEVGTELWEVFFPNGEQEFVLDEGAMAANKEGFENEYEENIFFSDEGLVKIISNGMFLPKITGMTQTITIDGEVVESTDGLAGEDEEGSESKEDESITPTGIPYPSFLFTGFINGLGSVKTGGAVKHLKSKYDDWNVTLNSHIGELKTELDQLTTKYNNM